jgi:hypothetical protein
MSGFKDIKNVLNAATMKLGANILSVVGVLLFSCCFACVFVQRNEAVSR